eukprot:TRINITY_DN766_c0_g1_i1.p2 TRINITY_DN766_c0_g1~~TRINITY_DN766_c0_g1_i1.p2  ORF type:complete len:805 (+),score=93.80 TRINITY_DN766_c0_g1_i1:687-3101(+)
MKSPEIDNENPQPLPAKKNTRGLSYYLRSKNWNVFAGDLEYKTNFFLKFKTPYTFIRYQNDKFQRYHSFIKYYLLFIAFTYLMLLPFAIGLSWLAFCLTSLGLVVSYVLLHLHFHNWIVRLALFLPEFLWTQALFSAVNGKSFVLYLVISHVTAVITDSLLVYEWEKHVLLQILKIVLKTLHDVSLIPCTFHEILAITMGAVLFGFFEKLAKEDWVLFDSFRRAQKIYMRMIDSNPYPSFVVTPKSKVLYCNEIAWIMLHGDKDMDERKLTKGFCEYKGKRFHNVVHPQQQAAVENILREVSRETTTKVMELLLRPSELPAPPRNEPSNEDEQHGTNYVNAGAKEEGYDYFMVTFKQFPWKQVNCILAVCENITFNKESYGLLFHNNKLLKERLQELNPPPEQDSEEANLIELRKTYYRGKLMQFINERSLLFVQSKIEGFYSQKEGFDISQWLVYLMEVIFVYAEERHVDLKFITEASFPKEVVGEREKFEVLLVTLLNFFVDHCEDEEVVLTATMITTTENGFILSFDISCTGRNEHINLSYLSKVLFTHQSNPDSAQYTLCKPLVDYMKGTIEVGSKENPDTLIHIELPFNAYEKSFILLPSPINKSVQYLKAGKYVYRWIWNEEKCKKLQEQIMEEESKNAGGQASAKNNLKKEEDYNWRRAEELIKAKLESRKQSLLVPQTPGLYPAMRKIRDRDEAEAMGNINEGKIFRRIVDAGGKDPDRSEQRPEDPELLAARKKMAEKHTWDDTFNVQKGVIKKRLSEKKLNDVPRIEDMRLLRDREKEREMLEYFCDTIQKQNG